MTDNMELANYSEFPNNWERTRKPSSNYGEFATITPVLKFRITQKKDGTDA